MPIDPRIALGVQPIQIDSPMRVVGQGLQLQNLLRQGDMQAMQMQDMQAGRERQNALRSLLAQDGDMATLPDRLIKGGFVDEGLKYRESIGKGEKLGAETQKAQLEAGALAAKQFADTMAGVRDQQSYQAAMSSLASNPAFAPMLQQLPQQWTPEFGQQAVRQAMIAHGKISELLPKFQQVDAGNRVITGAVDPQTAQFTQQGAPIVKAPQGFNVGADGALSADPGYLQAKQQIAAAGASRVNVNTGQKDANWGTPPTNFVWARDEAGNVITERDGETGAFRPKALPVSGGPGEKLPENQQKQVVGVKNLQNAITEYRAELAGFGALDTLSPDARARMGTKYNNMMLQAKEAYNLGVLNGPDFQILTSVITDPRSLTGAITSKQAMDDQASELSRIMSTVGAVSSDHRPRAGKPAQPSGAPKPGEVMDGYRFIGGNPADPASWAKQ